MPRLKSLLPLVLALVAVVLASGQTIAVPPAPVAGAAAVIVFAAGVALGGSRARLALDLPLILVLGLLAGHLFFTPGFPRGHDITNHLWGIWGFYKAILDGDIYPRWMHHLGLGMPLIQFYPPVSFYLLLPLLPFKLAPYDALKAGLILYSVLAGIAMYRVSYRWVGDRRAALTAALAYMWSPYMLLDSHYRVALAESAAFIFAPLFLDSGLRAVRSPERKTVAWAALWAALLIVTHPLSASMMVTAMALWLTVEFWPGRVGFKLWWRKLLTYGVVGVAALCMAGFYTLPLAFEAQYTTIGRSIGSISAPMYVGYGLYPWQLLHPRHWSGWQKAEKVKSEKGLSLDPGKLYNHFLENSKEMPYYVGLAWLALIPLAAGWWEGRRRAQAPPPEGEGAPGASPGRGLAELRAPAALLVVTASGLILTLRPLDMVMGYLPNFAMLQFPFRLIFLFTVGSALCAGYAAARLLGLMEERGRPALHGALAVAALGALLVADAWPYTGAPMWGAPYERVADQVGGGKACEEGPGCARSREITGEVPLRAEGTFFFPPADYSVDLGLLKHVYPEYFTPEVRKNILDKLKGEAADEALAEAGVGWSFSGKGSKPRIIEARPYAEWRPEGWKAGDPVKALTYSRKAGTILVDLPGGKGQVVVREQSFPGWIVETNIGWRDVNPTKDGWIQYRPAEDQTLAIFHFSEFRGDRFVGWLLTLAALLALFWPRHWSLTPKVE